VTSPARRHIVLVGPPGSGKTSVGEEVAGLLGTAFSDPDHLIESQLNSTIPEIFERRGEAFFRNIESEIVATLLGKQPHVISPGGGWILAVHESGTRYSNALIIYLETSPERIVERLEGAAGRPVMGDGSLSAVEGLLAVRRTAYEASEAVVATDGKDVAQVGIAVLGLARSKGGW
jgi:shikimate kinase